jgi:hypothetical protein
MMGLVVIYVNVISLLQFMCLPAAVNNGAMACLNFNKVRKCMGMMRCCTSRLKAEIPQYDLLLTIGRTYDYTFFYMCYPTHIKGRRIT